MWLVAAMSVRKPATMWTVDVPTDADFANGMLHGIYPMAPAPSGDHSLGMNGLPMYLKYGPMLRAIQGRIWRLEPHAVKAMVHPSNRGAGIDDGVVGVDANLFETPGGALIAVVRPVKSQIMTI